MTQIVGDDEAEIEAEIRRQLDEISTDDLDVEDIEDDISSFEENEKQEDLPESIEEYLKYVQSRTESIQQGVQECDSILLQASDAGSDRLLAEKIKDALGEDCHGNPLDIRNKVLNEIEENEEKEKQHKVSRDDSMVLDIVRPTISEEITLLEEEAAKRLQEFEDLQDKKNKQRLLMYDTLKKEENERLEREQNVRQQKQHELEEAQNRLNENQKAKQEKLEQDKKEEQKTLFSLEKKFQEEIKELEKEKEKQKIALDKIKLQEEEYQRTKRMKAAITIQKSFRGYRVYKQHQDVLQYKKRERQKLHDKELERKYQEEIRIKEEEKKLKEEEEKRRIENERLKREEQWKKEMEEKKRREEEERREEEKRKQEIKKREEEEERKKRKEEERKREEEAQKQEEKKRLEKERIRKEEEKRKEEEEKRKYEEKRRNEEEKKILENERIKQEERLKKEEEEKRKKELQEQREIEGKKQNEIRRIEEETRKEEQKKLERRKQEKMIEKERGKDSLQAPIEEEQKKEELKTNQLTIKDTKMTYQTVKINEQTQEINNELLQSKQKQATKGSERYSESYIDGDIEGWRKKWLKNHEKWSEQDIQDKEKTPGKLRSKTRARRPFSASKKLPQLTKDQILEASPKGTPLHKVVKMCLSSCSACNLLGLDSCTNLKTLSMTDCGLLAVEGLENCKDLQELYLKNNKIEYINLKELRLLEDINLCNNNLASCQGLEDCPKLKTLNLNNNRVTRIGDLSICCNLQCLSMDNNQLITTKGLSKLTKLQSFSCVNNHLPDVKEIDTCQLLQFLDLTGNNLQKPPLLSNHVLLHKLILDDNSISTLEPLESSWLPSLRVLSLSQNSVSSISSLNGCINLQTLDIRHNLISDVDSIVPGIAGCRMLKILKLVGNPVNEEPQLRETLSEALISLTQLDDETLTPKLQPDTLQSNFIAMCHKQFQENTELQLTHTEQLSKFDSSTKDPSKTISRLKLKTKQYSELYEQAVRHLVQHETFDSHEEPQSPAQKVSIQESKTISMPCVKVDSVTATQSQKTQAKDNISEKTKQESQQRIRESAAVKIQSAWKGWHIRHLIELQTKKWLAAVTIQAMWRGYQYRSKIKKRPLQVSRARKALWGIRHDAAATTIQACYRGYRVRRILAAALQNLKDDEEDDFDYDEEVDLSAFDFDTGILDDGWTPTDTPQLPSRGPVLPSTRQSTVPNKPRRQAWRSADSPFEQSPQASQPCIPPLNVNRSPEADIMSVTSGTQSHLTHRAEEMGSEWGLKNVSTAELMWKRANRMKYNPARKRKMLDPTKRLALFKKLDEANKLKEVKPPPRRQTQRVDYFAARDALLHSGHSTPSSERAAKAQMTYSWVHSQGVVHQDAETNFTGFTQDMTPRKTKKRSSSMSSKNSVTLPQLDPVQLAGKNIPLVSSPAFIRDQMVSKESTPRRNSSAEDVHFPPIKTYSVPNLAAHTPNHITRSNEKSNSAGARMTNEREDRR